jgi:NAD(P)-dependent dehydrogenase (short-subunit alcohol dehydrogenase family)
MASTFGLEGKVVVITGASSGMGEAAARAFAREGAKLVLGARRKTEGEAVAAALTKEGAEAIFVQVDVRKEEEIQNLLDVAVKKFGKIDIAFNNAGTDGDFTPFTEQTNENYDNIIDTNVKGVFWSMKHEIEIFLKQGHGVIVNNASMGSFIGFKNGAAYIASKHAVMGLTKTAALEYFPKGIRVNAVNPGIIDTPFQDRLWGSEEAKQKFAKSTIPERIGTADEVAESVLFLASDKASFISGHGLVIDGGYIVA